MGEAASYDGFVSQLAATGLTLINPPQPGGAAHASAAASGAASECQPWPQAEVSRDALQGLRWEELDVPHGVLEGALDRNLSDTAGLDVPSSPQGAVPFDRFGAGGIGSQHAPAPELQPLQQQSAPFQQHTQHGQVQNQPQHAAYIQPAALQVLGGTLQPSDGGWAPSAAAAPPSAAPQPPFSSHFASSRSTSAPQLMQRPNLLHGTAQPPHGWVPATDAATAQQHAQLQHYSSASDLHSSFLHAAPETRQQLILQADLLQRQQQLQYQHQRQASQQAAPVGGSPPSPMGAFTPRLAHATARLGEVDLSSRANSSNSRFSLAETATSSGSGPLGMQQPSAPAPPLLNTTIGFGNLLGMYPDVSPAGAAASTGQRSDPSQVMAAQGVQQQSQPQLSFDAELQQQSEHLQLHNMQQQLQGQQWQLQQQPQQAQVPLEHAETAMQQWIGMSTGMDWELGAREGTAQLQSVDTTASGMGTHFSWPLLQGVSSGEVTFEAARASPLSPVCEPMQLEVPAGLSDSLHAASIPAPQERQGAGFGGSSGSGIGRGRGSISRASAPAVSASDAAKASQQQRQRQQAEQQQRLATAAAMGPLSPQRPRTKRRAQSWRPPKPSAAAVLAAAEAAGAPPPRLRHPRNPGSRQRGTDRGPAGIGAAAAEAAAASPQFTAHDGSGGGGGGFSSSLVAAAAHLGELHAELQAGQARVSAAIEAIERGWNAEEHFCMPPELAAQIAAAADPEQQKGLERRERNRQSALAARSRRNEYDAALEALQAAMLREAAFYRSVLREASPEQQQQRIAHAPPAAGSPGASSSGSSRSGGSGKSGGSSRGAKKGGRGRASKSRSR